MFVNLGVLDLKFEHGHGHGQGYGNLMAMSWKVRAGNKGGRGGRRLFVDAW